MNFANKTIIITGASKGIGKVLALKLARQKANLVLAARDRYTLEITTQECINNCYNALELQLQLAYDV